MSEKRQENASQSGLELTASETNRRRQTRFEKAFLSFVAGSPDKEKIFLKKNHYILVSPHSTYIYSVLCGLTPRIF